MSLLLSLTITITIVSLRQKIKIKKTDTNKIVQTNKQNNITLKPQNKVLFPKIYILFGVQSGSSTKFNKPIDVMKKLPPQNKINIYK